MCAGRSALGLPMHCAAGTRAGKLKEHSEDCQSLLGTNFAGGGQSYIHLISSQIAAGIADDIAHATAENFFPAVGDTAVFRNTTALQLGKGHTQVPWHL